MNIGQAAQACGLPSKTIRFYEEIGLVVPERHETNNYRIYSLTDIEKLRFLQRARAAGFGVEECRELLTLYGDDEQRTEQTQILLSEYLYKLDQQFIALNAMRASLKSMIDQCIQKEVNRIDLPKVGNSSPLMAFTLIDSGRD